MQMVNPILTRYLYNRDEVIHSLLTSIIIKSSFQEVLFWTGELYYSGFHSTLWNFIWKFYYDFCALRNPKFEKIIIKTRKSGGKTPHIKSFIYLINMFYYSSSLTYTVFYLRSLQPKAPNAIYRGRPPKWLGKLNIQLTKKEKNLIRSIDKKSFIDIAFYLHQLISDPSRCYKIIKEYFTKIHGLIIKNMSLNDIVYYNKEHIIFAVICYLMEDEENINKKAIIRKLQDESIEFVEENNKLIEPCWKTLPIRRLFPINTQIGCFQNNRNCDILEWKHMYWYYWEYYTRECPLWKERFEKYKCTFDSIKKRPKFPDDDIADNFYEKYNLEPDEQSLECQNKSVCELDNLSLDEWIKYVFNLSELTLSFPNKKFIYID